VYILVENTAFMDKVGCYNICIFIRLYVWIGIEVADMVNTCSPVLPQLEKLQARIERIERVVLKMYNEFNNINSAVEELRAEKRR
jgi:hypothetical protein|tara:strand:+ start:234 stop:488 length:255 start_codon:yes stop_codon:yes gene_type:complete